MADKDIIVVVIREHDGQVVSWVRDRNDTSHVWPHGRGVVIDRAGRRPMTQDVVVDRAKELAALLGVPCEVDLEWRCARQLGLRCRCPKCVEKGVDHG